jgi:hypothetical protein
MRSFRLIEGKFKHIVLIGVIIILLTSAIQFLPSYSPLIRNAEADSLLILSTSTFFNSGKMEDVEVVGSGSTATLRLKAVYDWTEMNPSFDPAACNNHAMDSIYNTDKVITYGGYDGSQNYKTTMEYDYSDGAWRSKSPSNNAGEMWRHSVATIWGTDKLLLYDEPSTDTWVYDLSDNDWTEINPMVTPNGYDYLATIYGTDKVLLFNGNTWLFDLSAKDWTFEFTADSPGTRLDHDMAYVWSTDKVVLFGGQIGGSDRSDTWVYDLSDNDWTEVYPTVKPSARSSHAMAPIWGSDKIVLFSGTTYTNETWIYDLSDNQWTRIDIPYSPSARDRGQMACIYGTNKALLFGGWYVSQSLDDTWVFEYGLKSAGTFTSPIQDVKGRSLFKTLAWNATKTDNSNIKFQIRTAQTQSALESRDFVGPDGSSTDYYVSSPAPIGVGHSDDRYIQIKAYFTSSNFDETAVLKDIKLSYNNLPDAIMSRPLNESLLKDSQPKFEWGFADSDSSNQAAFQIVIDNDYDFSSIDYSSGEQSVSENQWQFPVGTSYTKITDGKWYWKIRLKDDDGDWGSFSKPWNFIIDTYSPMSSTTIPAHDGYYNNMNSISGTSYDLFNGSGIKKVEISIQRLNDKYYWKGANWGSGEHWLTAAGTTAWSFDTNYVIWSSEINYIVTSRATDNALRVEEPDSGNQFMLDFEAPESHIENPKDQLFIKEMDNINGAAMDSGGSGIDTVEICIEQVGANKYWVGTIWYLEKMWLATEGTKLWTFDAKSVVWQPDTNYKIHTRATDKAGNIEAAGDTSSFMFDNVSPVPSIAINEDDTYTTHTNVILMLQSEDSGSGTAQMSFSKENNVWSNWEAFSATKTFELIAGDGEKTVYYKVSDKAGNVAQASDTIVLDSAPPHSLYISINNGEAETSTRSVTLSLQATDITSGVYQMAFSNDGTLWSDWEPFTGTKSYTLLAKQGEEKVYFIVKDHAGNTAEAVSTSIILKVSSGSPNGGGPAGNGEVTDEKSGEFSISPEIVFLIIFVVIIIALFIFAMYITKKREKKELTDAPLQYSLQPPVPGPPGSEQAGVQVPQPVMPPDSAQAPQQSPTAAPVPAAAPGAPQQDSGEAPICQNCFNDASFIEGEQRWYCSNCKKYL